MWVYSFSFIWPRTVLYLVSSAVLVLYFVPGCPTSINHISITHTRAVYLQRAICLFSSLLVYSPLPIHLLPVCLTALHPCLYSCLSWDLPSKQTLHFQLFQFTTTGAAGYCLNICRCSCDYARTTGCVLKAGINTQAQQCIHLPPKIPYPLMLCSCLNLVPLLRGTSREHSSNLNTRISIWSKLWVCVRASEQDRERKRGIQ